MGEEVKEERGAELLATQGSATGGGGGVLRLFVPVTEGRVHRVALGERSLAEELARATKDKVVKPHDVLEVVVTLPVGYVVAGLNAEDAEGRGEGGGGV